MALISESVGLDIGFLSNFSPNILQLFPKFSSINGDFWLYERASMNSRQISLSVSSYLTFVYEELYFIKPNQEFQ